MIAAVTDRAFDVVSELAPRGVDVRRLPDGHPLWRLALAITPHNAGDTPAADERAVRFAAEQLVRFARGEPLKNVVPPPG